MKFKFRRYYLYYLGRCLAFIIYLFPLRMGLILASLLGRIAFGLVPKYRNLALENLRAAFPEKGEAEIRRIAIGVFENLAKVGIELINFPKITKDNLDRFVTVENIGIFDEARKKGNGIIVLTAHFGNWELLAMTIRLKGYPGAAVGRRIYFHKFDRYLNELRKTGLVNVIDRTESPRRFLKVLRSNEILGMLADQDVDSVEGVFVNFFGTPAYTPIGPAVLASVTGAALVPVFIVRKGLRHRFIVEKPVELVDTGNKEADILTNTQKWSDVVESYIKKYPDHWVWMHRRWKTRPK
ncbi:MAG: lysophospholipid acyltransferase family protein [Candidatus Omnitrophica bacterium]|nr:lysophospholipid acyltransferase family protein [Candidatus Omnitrophota bacterium]